jgi:phosphoribosylformylglycinamidine (FGAM) synthase PurS component
MSYVIISIQPRKAAFDPLATQVKADLIEAGQKPADALVVTERLFRLEGDLSEAVVKKIAETLLVDPVVENYTVESSDAKKKPSKSPYKGALVVDVWPKPGVTDPVAHTVQKGMRDMGLARGITASTATRYIFPKAKETRLIETLAKRTLANELIHDIDIRTN